MGRFIKAAKRAEIAQGSVKQVVLEGRYIALCNVQGDIYAIDDLCTHAEAFLSEGRLEGDEVECPRHGARFEVKTGRVTAPPAFEDAEVLPVRIVGDDVEVEV